MCHLLFPIIVDFFPATDFVFKNQNNFVFLCVLMFSVECTTFHRIFVTDYDLGDFFLDIQISLIWYTVDESFSPMNAVKFRVKLDCID